MRRAVIAGAVVIAGIGIGVAMWKRSPPHVAQVVGDTAPAALDARVAPIDPRVFDVEISQIIRACEQYRARRPLFLQPRALNCADLAALGCAVLEHRCTTMPIGDEEIRTCRSFMDHLRREVCNPERARDRTIVVDPAAYLIRELRAVAETCKITMRAVGQVPAENPARAVCTNITDGLRRLCEASKAKDQLAAALAQIEIVKCEHVDPSAARPTATLIGTTLEVATRDDFDDPDDKIACAIARALGVEWQC